jgi:cytochrome c oxidase subunit IV
MTASPARATAAFAYIGVLVVLLLLTALTVGVSFVEMPGAWHLGWGLSVAVLKASLVVLVFMHVLHSSAATRAVIVVAVFWLVGVFLALTLSDYATREVIPGLSGH